MSSKLIKLYDEFDNKVKDIFILFVYEFNTKETRLQMIDRLNSLFRAYKQNKTIFSYNITCDESNNTLEIIDNSSAVIDIRVKVNEQDNFFYSRRFTFLANEIKITTI